MTKKTVKHAKTPEQVKVFSYEPAEHAAKWLKSVEEEMQKPFDVSFNANSDGSFNFSFNFKGVR